MFDYSNSLRMSRWRNVSTDSPSSPTINANFVYSILLLKLLKSNEIFTQMLQFIYSIYVIRNTMFPNEAGDLVEVSC